MRDLGALAAGGTSDAGADQPINERGHVVGYASTATGAYHAFLWTPADGMRDLGALPSNPAGLSFANVVNNTGLVAGQGTLVNGATNGMAWTARRGMVEIPTLGGTPSGASIITDAGMVGGTSGTPSGFIHAFTWTQQGGVRDLGTAGYDESFLAGTRSSNGYVAAGLRNFGGYTERAALWLGVPGTPLIDLGTFGGPISFSSDVNNKAHVVGQADISTYNRVPFIWSFRDGMVPLNTRIRHAPPGLVVSYPFRLSNSGRILSSTMAGNFVLLKPDCNCGGSHSHTVGPVDTPDTVQVGGSFDASVSFTDDDATARHNIVWTWGDGTGSQQGNAQERGGAGRAGASHRYTAPGIYTVSVQVGDRSGQGPTVTRTIVAYSPGPGGAVGNGWIISPAGAMANSLHDTRAAFSVLVPASTADRTLAAQASLRFHVGRLNFRSDTLARVPAQDGHARFEGSGTVNGKQGYRFNLALSAGAPEPGQAGRVGLKIWHRDAVTNRDMIDYQHADNHHDEASADTAPVSQGQIILQ